jgi:NADP-dependent aldehyde dehydrogenase
MPTLNALVRKSEKAFWAYSQKSGDSKAAFLETIAQNIEALGEPLLETAARESNLPLVRLTGERGRTTSQLSLFADLLREGSWVDARIDTALPDRQPAQRPDLRRMLRPIGTVAIFGASNFPLAFSTAGGDTASALAAGCPVIVKGHPAHPETSAMVAEAIQKAAKQTKMPDGVFAHIAGDVAVGKALVKHPSVRAVGFTGSYAAGKSLFDIANRRKVPIPVFAEMGSVNPVFLFEQALILRGGILAQQLADSVALGVGQFCTNPGLIIGVKSQALTSFVSQLTEKLLAKPNAPMLHAGIAAHYRSLLDKAKSQTSVTAQTGFSEKAIDGYPAVLTVEGTVFLKNKKLHTEIFGPATMVVLCDDWKQVQQIVANLEGQLTATLMAEPNDLAQNQKLIAAITGICGRIMLNNVPTGVEVVSAMQHGGPFPASTDSRFTSVGTAAILRWVRPVAYQNFPDDLLPDELKENNPLSIRRLVNGKWA